MLLQNTSYLRPATLRLIAFTTALLVTSYTDAGEARSDGTVLLSNEHVGVAFLPTADSGRRSFEPVFRSRSSGDWQVFRPESGIEQYLVISGSHKQLDFGEFYPVWGDQHSMFQAGSPVQFIPSSVEVIDDGLRVDFERNQLGSLVAFWHLEAGERAFRVKMLFRPAEEGEYSLGYRMPIKQDMKEVAELLMPPTVMRKNLPVEPVALVDPLMPTPMALLETNGGWVGALSGDPGEIPFEWPSRIAPNFGLMLRHEDGSVQPSIAGPVPGTQPAQIEAGEVLEFSFRVLIHSGGWYSGYRIVADEVFQNSDYRKNHRVSLSSAALNMIDLLRHDGLSGWWDRAKAFHQIESRNGSTQAAPMVFPSLYRLTGDDWLLEQRVYPSIEFALSRSSFHFSPIPDDTGHYGKGSMRGPINAYGSTTFSGLWELTGRQTPALWEAAFPSGKIKVNGGYSHSQRFDEWLTLYEQTGDRDALDRAMSEADDYIEKAVIDPKTNILRVSAFFLIQYLPNWEGLLRLYEATGEERYLKAAADSARWLMTGVWTQPRHPDRKVTIHEGGAVGGDLPSIRMRRGDGTFRLGYTGEKPRFGTQVNPPEERDVDGWLISPVGMAFEQPTTLSHFHDSRKHNRLIYQSVWAPAFLRLGLYTGEEAFITYARNSVVGRFGNYPGYYMSDLTDLPLDPDYPLDGPDLTMLYYHHIPVHLGWVIDYLVSDAERRSQGKIDFPALWQTGYAYFNFRVFGHAPGNIFGHDNLWLWFDENAIKLDQPQLNHLLAHDGETLYIILMNESDEAVSSNLLASTERLGVGTLDGLSATILDEKGEDIGSLACSNELIGEVNVPSRGLRIIRLGNLAIEVESQNRSAPLASRDFSENQLKVSSPTGMEDVSAHAAAVSMREEDWQVFTWVDADAGQLEKVIFTLKAEDGSHRSEATISEYPFEYSALFSREIGAGIVEAILVDHKGKHHRVAKPMRVVPVE